MTRTLILLGTLLIVSCSNFGQLQYLADFPKSLDEVSGLISLKDSTVWAIEDGGNKDEIYKVNFNGDILKTFKVKNAKNHDWEDITKDTLDNIYIADTGNNANDRKNLSVYKLLNPETEHGDKIAAEKIEFYYPEQKKYPPKKSKKFYDVEAVFHAQSKLYLVTKNRAKPFNGKALIYTIPDIKGKHAAKLVGTIDVCEDLKTCQITAIAISPDGKKIVALSYGKLFVFTGFSMDNFSKGIKREIDLGARSQLESICFLNDTTLLIADEVSHGRGGNLYKYTLTE